MGEGARSQPSRRRPLALLHPLADAATLEGKLAKASLLGEGQGEGVFVNCSTGFGTTPPSPATACSSTRWLPSPPLRLFFWGAALACRRPSQGGIFRRLTGSGGPGSLGCRRVGLCARPHRTPRCRRVASVCLLLGTGNSRLPNRCGSRQWLDCRGGIWRRRLGQLRWPGRLGLRVFIRRKHRRSRPRLRFRWRLGGRFPFPFPFPVPSSRMLWAPKPRRRRFPPCPRRRSRLDRRRS